MNIKHIFLVAIIGTNMIAQTTTTQKEFNNNPQWKEWCASYATSCIAGGLVGLTTGNLSSYAIKRTFPLLGITETNNTDPTKNFAFLIIFIIVLITENKLRKILVNEINQNFKDFSINCRENSIYNTAWIASWVGFLFPIKKLSRI